MRENECDKFSNCTIAILTYDRIDQLEATLASLRKEFFDYSIDVIVIDNGSTASSRVTLERLALSWKNLSFYSYEENLGCSKGRSVAWERATTDYILALDDDITLGANDLLEMLNTIEEDPSIAVVSPLISDSADGRISNPVEPGQKQGAGFYEACFLIRRAVFGEVGYFDEQLRYAGEGLDFGLRLNRIGYNVQRAATVVVIHYDRARTSADLVERRKQWLWSFARVYCKNLAPPIAIFLSLKCLAAHIFAGRKIFSITDLRDCLAACLGGCRSGFRVRKLTKANVCSAGIGQ